MKKSIRIGTRGSPLALIQAEEIRKRLHDVHPHLASEVDIEIVPIRTTGDWRPEHKDQRFVDMGGNKGLFTKEIEEALLANYIDIAVHSMKDIASVLPDSLEIAAVIERNDARDALICRDSHTLDTLPQGSRVGTSSLRRQAQLLAMRPDLQIVPLRGNVETRLKKLESGQADATLLAVAGLSRLKMEHRISSIIAPHILIPAAGQGALGVEIRKGDVDIRDLVAPIGHQSSHICTTAERAVMRAIDGSCHTPAGAYSILISGQVLLEAVVARPDGSNLLRLKASGDAQDADKIGETLGLQLRARSPADLFAA